MNANHALWQFCVPEPTLQNHCHTQALEDALKVPSTAVYSVVAFVGHSQLEGNLPANVMQGQECVQFMRSFANLLWRNAEVQQLVEQLEMKRFPPRVQPTACMYARSGNDIALAVETLVQLAAVPWSCQQHGLEPGQENSSGAVFVIATAKQCSRCESLCKLTLGRRSEQSDSLKNQI